MICRFLSQADAAPVEKLWDSCFEKRNDPFFQYYFREYCFKENRVFGGFTNEGELITMLHLNPYTLRIDGKLMKIPYIVGVATAEKYRGHHYMGEMLSACELVLRQERVPFVFLKPVAASIYIPYGFVGVDYHTHFKFKEIQQKYDMVRCDLEIGNFASLYDVYMQQHNGVVRSEADWVKLIVVARLENNVAYLLRRENKICGYAIVNVEGDVVEVISPSPLPCGSKPFIMAKCLEVQDYMSYFGNNLYINEYF